MFFSYQYGRVQTPILQWVMTKLFWAAALHDWAYDMDHVSKKNIIIINTNCCHCY